MIGIKQSGTTFYSNLSSGRSKFSIESLKNVQKFLILREYFIFLKTENCKNFVGKSFQKNNSKFFQKFQNSRSLSVLDSGSFLTRVRAEIGKSLDCPQSIYARPFMLQCSAAALAATKETKPGFLKFFFSSIFPWKFSKVFLPIFQSLIGLCED